MEDALAIDEDDEGWLAAIVEGEEFLELVGLEVGELGIEVAQGDGGALGVEWIGVGDIERQGHFFKIATGLHEDGFGDEDAGALARGLGNEFHLAGEDESGEFTDAFAAFDGAVEIGRAVAFSAKARAGDVEVFGFEFGGLHAAAVVLHDDGGFGEDIRDGDLDLGGLGVPCVVHEFLQRLFTRRVVLAEDMGELGIDAEVGCFLHEVTESH